MYLKFILIQLLMAVAFILNLFIFPISYVFRKSIVKHPKLWKWLVLYWFSDNAETWGTKYENYLNNWYGIYELLKDKNGYPDYIAYEELNWFQKFMLSYRWAALRNPNWNLQILFKPKDGDKYRINVKQIEGIDKNPLRWRNKHVHGIQSVTYYVEGTKYFRYSSTRYNSFFKKYVNVMLGAGDKRFILKLRFF